MNRDDVRVRQSCRRLSFPGEALPDVTLEGELRRQHLDGYPALQPLVAGPVDHAHATPADLAFDRVSISQRLAKAGGKRLIGRVGHARCHLCGAGMGWKALDGHR